MSAPTQAPGHGALAVARVDGASALVRARAHAPLHLRAPRPRGPAVWAYAVTFGGGLVAGDHIALDVEVGPGAAALLSTQSTTKVYRSPGPPAVQETRARVAAGGLLALWPDPVSCFAGARYEQRVAVDLEPGASLLLVDGLVSGRAARRERWQFAAYRSVIEVRAAGTLVLRDALTLEDGPEGTVAERLGRHDALAVAVLLGPALADLAAAIRERGAAQPSIGAGGIAAGGGAGGAGGAIPRRGAPEPLLAAALPLGEDGVLWRAAGEQPEAVGAALRRELAGIGALLGGDPWARKY